LAEGEEIVPEELKKQEKPFNRLFLETQILLFVLFIVVGMAVFTLLTFFYPEAYSIAPLILVAAQFVLVFTQPSSSLEQLTGILLKTIQLYTC